MEESRTKEFSIHDWLAWLSYLKEIQKDWTICCKRLENLKQTGSKENPLSNQEIVFFLQTETQFLNLLKTGKMELQNQGGSFKKLLFKYKLLQVKLTEVGLF